VAAGRGALRLRWFVGREAELAALRDWWESRPDRPALVWGRRRVGKTALIERFADGLSRVVFHTAIERGRGQAVLPAIERELDNVMGLPYEEAFRECLWEKAFDGTLGISDVVDIGPWWAGGGQEQIDAVLLAEPELTRIPVAVGESKWARSVNGARQRAKLTAKAAALTPDVDRLAYIVCGRSEVVTQPGSDTIAITAADIFPDPS